MRGTGVSRASMKKDGEVLTEQCQSKSKNLIYFCQIGGKRRNLGCCSFIFSSSWPHAHWGPERPPQAASVSGVPQVIRTPSLPLPVLFLLFPSFFLLLMFLSFFPHYCFTSLPSSLTCISIISLPSAVPSVPASSPFIPWLTLSSLFPLSVLL